MATPLTYLGFHAAYLLPSLVVLAASAAVARRRRRDRSDGRIALWGYLLVAALAVLYTTPWDGYLIDRGVWYYGDGRVAARFWGIPVEEVLFFVLQPALTTLWTVRVWGPVRTGVEHSPRDRIGGAATGLAVGVAGLALLTTDSTFYLGAILAWAGPVLALQWAVGWRYLVRDSRRVALAVLVPSAYLWAIDRIAIRAGVWTIAERYTTGLAVAGLPVEEMLFFVVTNLFVVQGLVLFRWEVHRWR